MTSATQPLLEVQNLRVSFRTPDGIVEAVRGISFSVEKGKVLGIVGESGSGKSVATQAMVGLVRGAQVTGKAIFEGRDLLELSPEELRGIRGRGIAMIFQNPLSGLHPLYRIGWQIIEMIQAHESMTKRQARARAIELLGLVGIPRPDRRVDDYPHQFSGGMLQRAMIAMALALNPRLLLADAMAYYKVAWWFVFFPGAALLITTIAFNILGDGVRDALDPHRQVLPAIEKEAS